MSGVTEETLSGFRLWSSCTTHSVAMFRDVERGAQFCMGEPVLFPWQSDSEDEDSQLGALWLFTRSKSR